MRFKLRRFSFFLVLMVVGAVGVGVAQESASRTPLTAEVLWQMQRIGNPVISPDGRWVVAPVTRYTVSDDKAHTDLWLFATDGSVRRALTSDGGAGQPVFSPDGRHLAFVTRRTGDTAGQIYLLPLTEPGEASRLTNVPTGVSGVKWVGAHLYFVSTVWPGKTWDEMKAELDRLRTSPMSARTWNALPYNSWDRWIDEARQTHLFRIPAAGGEVEAITQPTGWELSRTGAGTGSYDVSPDGQLVVFQADSRRDGFRSNFDLFAVAPGSAEARNLTPESEGTDASPLFSPDGSRLAYVVQRINGFYADTRQLHVRAMASGAVQNVTAAWDRSADGLVWAPDGSGLYGAIDDASVVRLYFIPLAGTPRAITQGTDFGPIDISRSGTLVSLNQSFLYPARLGLVNTNTGAFTRLDTFNDDILANVDLGTYESVTYEGANGAPIQMWVHYPPGFDRTKRYPLMLLLHGGPHNAITDAFSYRWNAQTFASWGYVTAWHNFHGSSGFGQDFADAINPDWVTLPYEDTRRAADWFAAKPWIDADRMVAAGASYGGFLGSVLLGREHPFKALVIHAAVYNLYSQMAGDFGVNSVRFGDFWEHDHYAQSPHYRAGNFTTPSLIIHGQLDYRVPVGQGFELFRTLQQRGIPSRMIYFPDENHWILKPNNSLYWYQQVRDWVQQYATPGGQ